MFAFLTKAVGIGELAPLRILLKVGSNVGAALHTLIPGLQGGVTLKNFGLRSDLRAHELETAK